MVKFVEYKKLITFSNQLLIKSGLDKFSAKCVSSSLCETSLRGVDSHGIKLLPAYVEFALKGRKNGKPKFKFNNPFPSFGVLDADNGFGLAAGLKAIDLGIKIAKKNGVSIISVKNSSHPGALASMTLKAARSGYAAFAFTHADSLMLSHNSTESFFGTNPISFACPRSDSEPFCVDMATTMISWNKLLNARVGNKKLLDNLASNISGKSTTNPFLAKSLFPIGSYKGFALASMVEVLCGIMTGMPYGKKIPPMFTYPSNKKRPLGQFYIILRVDAILTKKQFKNRMKEFSNLVRKQKPLKGKKVQMPNDPEIDCSLKRLKEGIPISKSLFNDIYELGRKNKLKLINK